MWQASQGHIRRNFNRQKHPWARAKTLSRATRNAARARVSKTTVIPTSKHRLNARGPGAVKQRARRASEGNQKTKKLRRACTKTRRAVIHTAARGRVYETYQNTNWTPAAQATLAMRRAKAPKKKKNPGAAKRSESQRRHPTKKLVRAQRNAQQSARYAVHAAVSKHAAIATKAMRNSALDATAAAARASILCAAQAAVNQRAAHGAAHAQQLQLHTFTSDSAAISAASGWNTANCARAKESHR